MTSATQCCLYYVLPTEIRACWVVYKFNTHDVKRRDFGPFNALTAYNVVAECCTMLQTLQKQLCIVYKIERFFVM